MHRFAQTGRAALTGTITDRRVTVIHEDSPDTVPLWGHCSLGPGRTPWRSISRRTICIFPLVTLGRGPQCP